MALTRNGWKSLLRLSEVVARPFNLSNPSPVVAACLQTQHLTPGGSTRSGLQIPTGSTNFHTCAVLQRLGEKEPEGWPRYNKIVYPPQKPGDPVRPAEVFHYKANIKYSQKKMWYISLMLRGMSVDEAIKQLSFMQRKGADIAKETILEAQEMAVREHNVEFKSNLWIADSFVTKAGVIKGPRKHARGRMSLLSYGYIHYFVCLREGPPPKKYYDTEPNGHQKVKDYIQERRDRCIKYSL